MSSTNSTFLCHVCDSTHQTGSPPNAADLWCGSGQSRYHYIQKDTSVQKALKVIQFLQLRREPRWTSDCIQLTRFLKGDTVSPIKPSGRGTSTVCHLIRLPQNKSSCATREGTASGGWGRIEASIFYSYPPCSARLLFKHHPDTRTVSNDKLHSFSHTLLLHHHVKHHTKTSEKAWHQAYSILVTLLKLFIIPTPAMSLIRTPHWRGNSHLAPPTPEGLIHQLS